MAPYAFSWTHDTVLISFQYAAIFLRLYTQADSDVISSYHNVGQGLRNVCYCATTFLVTTHTITATVLRPFVQYYPGEPVPEESLSDRISLEPHVRSLPNFCTLPMATTKSAGDKIPRERGNFGGFPTHWQCIVTTFASNNVMLQQQKRPFRHCRGRWSAQHGEQKGPVCRCRICCKWHRPGRGWWWECTVGEKCDVQLCCSVLVYCSSP